MCQVENVWNRAVLRFFALALEIRNILKRFKTWNIGRWKWTLLVRYGLVETTKGLSSNFWDSADEKFSRLRKEAKRFLARGLGVRGLLGGAFFSALTFLHTSLARERFPVWKSLPSHFFSFATFSAQEVFKLPQSNFYETIEKNSSWIKAISVMGVHARKYFQTT